MASPYTSPALGTGYNVAPPADDGSEVETNRVKWATVLAKLTDILKGDDVLIDAAVAAAFEQVLLNSVTAINTNYTIVTTDRGKLIEVTGTRTITFPTVASAGSGFAHGVKNAGAGTVTCDGNGTETIDGELTLDLLPGQSAIFLTNGTNWRVVSESIDPGLEDQVLTMSGSGKQWETPAFGLVSIQSFATPGADTWVKPLNMRRIRVFAIGGGGGSAGSTAATGIAGGGGAGEVGITFANVDDLQFQPADVNITTNVISISGHDRRDDDKVQVSTTDTMPGGLTVLTDYFVVTTVAGVSFQLATTKGGGAINLTTQGVGLHTLELISIDMTVGAAGGAGTSSTSGTAGGDTTFGTTYASGSGGSPSLFANLNGGVGGSGGTGDVLLTGGAGGAAGSATGAQFAGAGGAAGSNYGGQSAQGRGTAGTGTTGLAPGGGAGGANGTTSAGGAGAIGSIFVEEYN